MPSPASAKTKEQFENVLYVFNNSVFHPVVNVWLPRSIPPVYKELVDDDYQQTYIFQELNSGKTFFILFIYFLKM